ncbi:CAPZB protein, partial [Polypterus senegalus]
MVRCKTKLRRGLGCLVRDREGVLEAPPKYTRLAAAKARKIQPGKRKRRCKLGPSLGGIGTHAIVFATHVGTGEETMAHRLGNSGLGSVIAEKYPNYFYEWYMAHGLHNDQQLDCALDLMRRLPPQQIEKNLSDLIDLVPSLCEDLLSSVDQPLKIARDKTVGKDYLLCDYNRDGDSYRSPWSNKYEPPIEDGAMPSARLRKLEIEANNAFDQYRDLYFEGGVSSVYLWDLDHGFAGVILIKKAGDGSKKIKGCWDSIHVVEVQEKSSGRTAHYKLTSTVMLWLQTTKTGSGTMNLGGSLTRQMEKDETVSDSSPHIANIGRLVEDMENKIRSTLNEIYFGKTKDIVNGLRSVQTMADKSRQDALKNDLMKALKGKQQS